MHRFGRQQLASQIYQTFYRPGWFSDVFTILLTSLPIQTHNHGRHESDEGHEAHEGEGEEAAAAAAAVAAAVAAAAAPDRAVAEAAAAAAPAAGPVDAHDGVAPRGACAADGVVGGDLAFCARQKHL